MQHPRPFGFWKVGTRPAVPVDVTPCQPSPAWLASRTDYGGHVDPGADLRHERVYTEPRINSPDGSRRSMRIGFHPPKLGIGTIADRILWKSVCSGIEVELKEIDQLIAAFADDEGRLIRNRGRVRPGKYGGYRGAIEIIDGGTDLHDLIRRIGEAASPVGRRLSALQRRDIETLAKSLSQDLWKLRPGAPTAE